MNEGLEIIYGEPPVEETSSGIQIIIGEQTTPEEYYGTSSNDATTSEPLSSETTSSEPTSEPVSSEESSSGGLTSSDVMDIINGMSSAETSAPVSSELPVSSALEETSSIVSEPTAFEKPFDEYTVQDFGIFAIMVILMLGIVLFFCNFLKEGVKGNNV